MAINRDRVGRILWVMWLLLLAQCTHAPQTGAAGPGEAPQLGTAVVAFQQRMRSLATERPDVLNQMLKQIYGSKLTPLKQAELIALASHGEIPVPELQWADSEILGGAFGAYSSEGSGTIFINKSLTLSPDHALAVLIEEVGHHLDQWLGGPDTAGDEGQMFLTAIARGTPLTDEEMYVARAKQERGILTLNGRHVTVELALPVAVGWLAKAAGATAADAFLEYGIAALTGTPPGVLTHVGNFAMNVVPGVGEARKVKLLSNLLRTIDVVVDTVRAVSRFPGGELLLKAIAQAKVTLSDQITNGNLNAAKGALINIIGRLREAQIALRLQKNGAEILQLGKKVKHSAGSDALTDIDVIAREGSQVFFSQVKAASALAFGKGSTRWPEFTRQVDATLDFASKNGGKVRYYVDEISDDVLKYLHDRGIEVIQNAKFLQ
jgi:hypothetical protein